MSTKLPAPLAAVWAEAERTGQPVPVGDTVVCDVCDDDYTSRPESGGFVFGSYAYCPSCATKQLPSIRGYGEEHLIRAHCPPGLSFADFVRDLRGPNAYVHVSGLSGGAA